MSGIFTRRNALFGWIAWRIAKRTLKRRLARAEGSARTRALIVGAVAASAGAVSVLVLRRRSAASGRSGDVA